MSTIHKMSDAERIAYLEGQLAKATAARNTLAVRVSAKGGVSVYGLQRWPVTLYKAQWERLINHAPTISKFIADNSASLATKETD